VGAGEPAATDAAASVVRNLLRFKRFDCMLLSLTRSLGTLFRPVKPDRPSSPSIASKIPVARLSNFLFSFPLGLSEGQWHVHTKLSRAVYSSIVEAFGKGSDRLRDELGGRRENT
jgi:hypothetical protein